MGFGEAIKTCFSKYVDFSGRAPRSEFWWFVLFGIICSVVLQIVDVSVLGADPAAGDIAILSSLFSLAILLPNIAVGVRRLHDTDRSGWWYLIVFVPIIGIIVLIIFWIMSGTEGQNRFG
ncbi:MAG: DUF805 domain-containing protein [Pseudomonadota bacterium]